MRAPHLLAVILVGACAMQPGDVNADGLVDCRDLDGTFEADAVRFVALDDPDLVEDFDGLVDLTTDFSFRDGTFTTTLRQDGEIVTSSGSFFFEGDDDLLGFAEPLIPGMAVRGSRVSCDYDFAQRELRLSGITGYTFDGSEGPVEAELEATFVGF